MKHIERRDFATETRRKARKQIHEAEQVSKTSHYATTMTPSRRLYRIYQTATPNAFGDTSKVTSEKPQSDYVVRIHGRCRRRSASSFTARVTSEAVHNELVIGLSDYRSSAINDAEAYGLAND